MSGIRGGQVGFYGKLPSRGDFVRVGLSRETASSWDRWVQSVLPPARRSLGVGWPVAWRDAPSWRFTAAVGLCGPHPVTGLWLPSRDAVGRDFPLLVAFERAACLDALAAMEVMASDAVRSGIAPDELSRRLNDAPRLGPAEDPGVGACWWTGPYDAPRCTFRTSTMPDLDHFIRMLD